MADSTEQIDYHPPVTVTAGKLLMVDGVMPLEIRLGGLGWQISAVPLGDDWKRSLVFQLRDAADDIEKNGAEALPPALAPYVSK